MELFGHGLQGKNHEGGYFNSKCACWYTTIYTRNIQQALSNSDTFYGEGEQKQQVLNFSIICPPPLLQ